MIDEFAWLFDLMVKSKGVQMKQINVAIHFALFNNRVREKRSLCEAALSVFILSLSIYFPCSMRFRLYKQQTMVEKMKKYMKSERVNCRYEKNCICRSQQKQTTTANKSVSSSVFYILASSGSAAPFASTSLFCCTSKFLWLRSYCKLLASVEQFG